MKKLLILSLILFLGINSVTFAYTDEEKKAYTYAFNKGITTMITIDNANMGGNLTRIAMAKMISNYATNVLKLKLDTTKKCKFADVTEQRDKQYDYGVTHVCQLGLMGIGDDGKIAAKFNPEGTLNRAQLITILSRALNKANGKEIANGDPYFTTHLDYLESIGVFYERDFYPYDAALRKEVMVLIYRSADEKNRLTQYSTDISNPNQNSSKYIATNNDLKNQTNVKTVNTKEGYTILNGNESYYNEYYGFLITHIGDNRWIVDIKGNKLTYGSFIPEKSGDSEIFDDYKSEYKNYAKEYNDNGYLIKIQNLYIDGIEGRKKQIESNRSEGNDFIPEISAKGYRLSADYNYSLLYESCYSNDDRRNVLYKETGKFSINLITDGAKGNAISEIFNFGTIYYKK